MFGVKKRKYLLSMDPGPMDMAIVAFQWGKNGDPIPSEFIRTPCRGFKNGYVVNMHDAITSVSNAVEKIKVKIGSDIENIYSTVSDASIKMIQSEGTVLLSKYGREIFERDIKKCVEIAKILKIPIERELLHSIVRSFSVDEEPDIMDPRKLEGVKLNAIVNNITINGSVIKNISRCIAQAGYVPAGFVFSGVALSYRSMDGNDRKYGGLLINICSSSIEAITFFQDILCDCTVIPFGAENILSAGGTLSSNVMSDILEKLRNMKGWKYVKKVILTGEAVLNDNLIELIEPHFDFPVQAGKCISKPFEHLPPDKAGYIGSLGVIDFLHEKMLKKKISGGIYFLAERISSFIDSYF